MHTDCGAAKVPLLGMREIKEGTFEFEKEFALP